MKRNTIFNSRKICFNILHNNFICRRNIVNSNTLNEWFKRKNSTSKKETNNNTLLNLDEIDKIAQTWKHPKILIVGAGIAGLSAAYRLVQRGLCNFTILEASDRPGGRINSSRISNCVAELGAKWIQGASYANSVFSLACIEGLLKSPLERQNLSKGMFYTKGGRVLDFSVVNMAYNAFSLIKSDAFAMYDNGEIISNQTLGKYMKKRIEAELIDFPDFYRSDAKLILNTYMELLKTQIGEDLDLINHNLFSCSSTLPGGNVEIQSGFSDVLAPLLRNLPDCSVHYSKQVNKINWGKKLKKDPRAIVSCCDGSEYKADYVILAFPLGVLKESHKCLFCPELPSKKTDAIKSLGFGHVNQLYLSFENPIWNTEEGSLFIARSSDDKYCDDWTKGLSTIIRVPQSKKVLYGVVAGNDALEMEKRTDAEVIQDVTKLMRSFTGNSSFPQANKLVRSSWSNNPLFNGAYTYLGLDSTLEHINDLANPVPEKSAGSTPILLFAGEHTSKNYATVHGARNSGVREADRIIELTTQFKGLPT
uniref:Amine oxidase domain-containing protein n=1 Tax=Clastoptera arizonana TaxID=38151 RepID=A0A1B6CJ39_9HEMI